MTQTLAPAQAQPVVTRHTRIESAGVPRPSTPPWPGGVRCVVVLTIDFDGTGNEVGKGWPPFGMHTAGRYSARRGVPRHLNMLERMGIPATFFVPGYDAQCTPAIVQEIARTGHEVASHGYVHEGVLLPPAEETARLELTHEILSQLIGEAPTGWRSPSGQKTSITLPVLKRLGYVYDSSDKDADAPYLLQLPEGDSLVEIPNNTVSLDDHPWFHFSMTPVSEVVAQWKAEFDAIYASRGYFMLTVHPRAGWGCGTPRRTEAMAEMIQYIQGHDGIQFMRLRELAGWVAGNKSHFDEVRI